MVFFPLPLFFPLCSDLLPPSLHPHKSGLAVCWGGAMGPCHHSVTRYQHRAQGSSAPNRIRLLAESAWTMPLPCFPGGRRPPEGREKELKKPQFTELFILEPWRSCTSPKWPVVSPWESTAGPSSLPGPASGVPRGCLLPRCAFWCRISPPAGTLQLCNSALHDAGFVNFTTPGLGIELKRQPVL